MTREERRKQKIALYLERNQREAEMERTIIRLMRGELVAVNPNQIGVNNGNERPPQGSLAAMES